MAISDISVLKCLQISWKYRGSAPNMGTFLIWAPLISVPYVTYAKEVRHVFCAPAMPKSSEHILASI